MDPISLSDFTYSLPENRIAKHPLPERHQSKLLVCENGRIAHHSFHQLPDILPINARLFFNNTKVLPARLLFQKPTGAVVEVFLLHPAGPAGLLSDALQATENTIWKCMVGNLKRWTTGTMTMQINDVHLTAEWIDRDNELVKFSWSPKGRHFAEVVRAAGVIPLPPYIKRDAEPDDRLRYQTVYSLVDGAVAAPTAGLHFTSEIMNHLKARGILVDYLTLHVGAGTFLPIKEKNAAEHQMHEEQLIVHKANIINLLQRDKTTVAVGTTSLRTLESIYWYGVMLGQNKNAAFAIPQYLPYQNHGPLPSSGESLTRVLEVMEQQNLEILTGSTSLYIVPGYRFRIVQGLVTNFHQPGSTLLLLVAAFLGPTWRELYSEALSANYRFLSYGDSSLLWPPNELIA